MAQAAKCQVTGVSFLLLSILKPHQFLPSQLPIIFTDYDSNNPLLPFLKNVFYAHVPPPFPPSKGKEIQLKIWMFPGSSGSSSTRNLSTIKFQDT
jgi:hypothetical protein